MRDIALLVLAAAAGSYAAHISGKWLHDEGIQIPGAHLDLLVKKNVEDFPEGPIGQWWSYGLQFEALNASIYRPQPPVILDMRNRTEANDEGMIPTSTILPIHELEAAFLEMTEAEFEAAYGAARPTPEQWNVVLTCTAGVRAMNADEILRGIGYERQRVYQGSFVDWVENGGEVVEADFEVDYDLK